MKAAVLRALNAPLEIEDVSIDDPAPGEVLVKTVACGICHSDLSAIEGKLPIPLPSVLGHEPGGIVEAVGEGVTDFVPGDHVIGCMTSFCGACKFCLGGRPNLCAKLHVRRPKGAKPRLTDSAGNPVFQSTNLSSFAEKILCPERSLVKIREDMPLDRASLIGCGVMTGLGAVLNTVHVRAGSSVVVIGCGGVGLSAVQGARMVGASQIIAIDAQPWKFDLARKCGATHCLDANDGDTVAAVQELTGGGAEFVFECIGLVATIQQAVSMTECGGTTVLVGVPSVEDLVPIPAATVALQEKKIVGSFLGSNRFRFDMPKYVEFYMSGRLLLDEMISSRVKLDDINTAFDVMRKGEAARQVIVFD